MQTMVLTGEMYPKPAMEAKKFSAPVVVLVALLVFGGVFAFSDPITFGGSSPASTNVVEGAYIIPSGATNGALSINIPLGTAARMRAGDTGYVLPNVIQLHVGDKIVITNNDNLPHMMLFTFIEPGQTIERVFDQITTETYSAGCTMDPTPSGFTSLFVSK